MLATHFGEFSVIEMEGAAYGYDRQPLLSGLSLQLAPGSFHFLTGPSGSGKTTFLKLCYAELLPTAGTVRILGEDVTTLNRDRVAQMRRRIGVVHQDGQFLDHLTTTENIALPLMVSGRATRDQAQNLRDLITWVGLKPRAKALPPELSGGERQRAALARAIIMDPEIILADEPTGNVDWHMSMRLMQLLIELNKIGKTVVIASHDLALIRATKTQVQARVLHIKNGQMTMAGADL